MNEFYMRKKFFLLPSRITLESRMIVTRDARNRNFIVERYDKDRMTIE